LAANSLCGVSVCVCVCVCGVCVMCECVVCGGGVGGRGGGGQGCGRRRRAAQRAITRASPLARSARTAQQHSAHLLLGWWDSLNRRLAEA
jgi:ribulose 1,5-bisphosphate carboxylase large subunit-like protein